MNWMYSMVFLFGLVLGAEIIWCVLTYRDRAKNSQQDLRRPCEIDGDKAYFHRWVGDRHVYALIEYLDGSVHKVYPERLQFTDQ